VINAGERYDAPDCPAKEHAHEGAGFVHPDGSLTRYTTDPDGTPYPKLEARR
jgi:hypothetical protein